MLRLLLWALLLLTPEARRALELYRTNPQQGLRSIQTMASLLRRRQGPEAALALLDSAYALRPDARITRWALDLCLQGTDTLRLRRYLFRLPHETAQPSVLTGVYVRLKTSPWRFLLPEWVDTVRHVLGADPFGRQHYFEALQRRDFPEALRWLFEVARQTGDLRWPLRELARLAPFVDLEDARAVLRSLGDFEAGHVLLSRLYLLKGRREDAYREALKARDPQTLALLAREALAEADVADALQLLQAIPEDRRGPEAWLLLAQVHRQLGDSRAALEAYRRALPRGRREFLEYLLQLGQTREVPRYADSTTLDLVAWAKVLEGDTARAESLAARISGPEGERLRILLALLKGRRARADTLIRRFVLHHPADPWAAEALTLLDLLQTAPELLPEIQRYLTARAPGVPQGSGPSSHPSPAALFLRARTAEEQGHLDVALGLYRELAEQDTTSWAALALYRAARIHQDALQDTATARTLWQQLIQRFPQSPYAALARGALP